MTLEQRDDIGEMPASGGVERIDAIATVQSRVRAGCQQHPADLRLPCPDRLDQRGISNGILGVDARASIKEYVHDLRIAARRGSNEWSILRGTPGIRRQSLA